MNQQEAEKALKNAKFEVGQRVYHENRREWVTITHVGISEKRWHDYGIIEVDYIATSEKTGSGCWGYENDFSESALTRWAGW